MPDDFRPHPTLQKYYPEDSAREQLVSEVFNLSAQHYDYVNQDLLLAGVLLALLHKRRTSLFD